MCSPITRKGFCLVVGTADAFMTARVNPGGGRETAQFEVCDNDRGKPQNSRTDAMRWRAAPFVREKRPHRGHRLTYLTAAHRGARVVIGRQHPSAFQGVASKEGVN